ncbi:MAG: hypothetical protein BWY09_01564 [Candidatus Hydrogenedentes bacterium ADurb.Bin179]|nr:MAG: hypothetical protein BWY09_01564 [Candidatus Hydrogenedentes bacterium ADurb.Bin179]
MVQISVHLLYFPSAGHCFDASLPSAGSPQGRVRPLQRYYQGAVTSYRPFPSTRFPSICNTTLGALSFLSRCTERTSRQPLGVGNPVTPARNSKWRQQDLSSSRVTSMFRLYLFQRPRTARHSQTSKGGQCCPHAVHDEDADIGYFRGSIARLSDSLSTLRSAGCPDATQDSLPAAGHALPGGLLPARSQRKVSYVNSTLLPPFTS